MSSVDLSRFGITPPTIVREPARDSQNVPICAECGHPVATSKGPQTIDRPDVVDRELRRGLDGELVTFGYRCERHGYDLVMPDHATGPDAVMHVDGWVGVELAFADEHTRHVPVPEKEVAGIDGGARADA